MRVFLLTIVVLLGSCNLKPSQTGLQEYYDLDSLLQSQFVELQKRDAKIKKSMTLNGEETTKTEALKENWDDEFILFKNFNPGEIQYANAFEVAAEEGSLELTPRAGEDTRLRAFRILGGVESPEEISGYTSESNALFSTQTHFEIYFQDQLMVGYLVKGGQKLYSKDSTTYQIKGHVIY